MYAYRYISSVLGIVFVLCCSVYCLCVNVYCTTSIACQPNCSLQICHIISYIISYHIVSYHTISYHVMSHHIIYHILYHIISCHIIYHIISYRICHILSYIITYITSYIISCHVISYIISYRHVMSYRTISYHIKYLMKTLQISDVLAEIWNACPANMYHKSP
jgi:hypothetical protein